MTTGLPRSEASDDRRPAAHRRSVKAGAGRPTSGERTRAGRGRGSGRRMPSSGSTTSSPGDEDPAVHRRRARRRGRRRPRRAGAGDGHLGAPARGHERHQPAQGHDAGGQPQPAHHRVDHGQQAQRPALGVDVHDREVEVLLQRRAHGRRADGLALRSRTGSCAGVQHAEVLAVAARPPRWPPATARCGSCTSSGLHEGERVGADAASLSPTRSCTSREIAHRAAHRDGDDDHHRARVDDVGGEAAAAAAAAAPSTKAWPNASPRPRMRWRSGSHISPSVTCAA